MAKIIIKNGTIIDGTGKAAFKADISTDAGVISRIVPDIMPKAGETVIDAAGHFVTPGFIDIQNHSDSYWTVFDHPEQLSMLSQGITTIILGNCGASLAPLLSPEAIKSMQKWHNLNGVNVNWISFDEFTSALSAAKLGVNVGSLVGHATLRRGLLGDQVRSITADELKVMVSMLNQSLDEGALGLSLGLVYAHEVDSTKNELELLAKTLNRQDKYLSVHLRSEGAHILEAVDEAIDLSEKSGAAVKISHLKIRGKENWHLFDKVMNRLENAYHQGLKISFDVYPYTTSWSVLYTYLPRWAYEGGRAQILRRLATESDRRKIMDYLREQKHDYDNITIAAAEFNPGIVNKTISALANGRNTSGEDALLTVLEASKSQAIVFDNNLSPEHVELLLSSPLSMIATDGAGYSREAGQLVHPRCFGAMPKFLNLVNDKKILKWEQAIMKITSEPARLLGLRQRGILAAEASADIVVFDPETVKDRADYAQPYQIADGIKAVMVNGQIAFSDGLAGGMSGQVIRR